MIRNEKTKEFNAGSGFTHVDRFTNDDLLPASDLYKAQNVDLTLGVGKVKTCLGYGAGANITSGTLRGAHCFFTSSGSSIPLAHIGTTMYRYVGSWSATSLTTLAAANSEFTTFLDYEFVTDGTQVLSSTNGSTWGATKLTSAPTTGIIDMESWKGRLYFLDKKQLNWSSIVDTSLNITWDTTNYNVQINPYDGDYNTALARLRQRLIIFKNYSSVRFYQYANTTVDISSISEKIGTPSTRSFVVDPDGTLCYLFGTSVDGYKGIFVTDGESMTVISRPVQDILDGVPDSFVTSVRAGISKDKIKFYLGDVTLKDGSTISKCELQYSPVMKIWQWRSLSHIPVLYTPFLVGSTRSLYFLDTSSNLYQDDTGTTFGGNPIHSEIETPWRRYGQPSIQLTARDLTITGQNIGNIITRVSTIDNDRFISGAVRKKLDYINLSTPTLKGSRFKINVSWTQPSITYEADRVSVENIYLGFKDDRDPI